MIFYILALIAIFLIWWWYHRPLIGIYVGSFDPPHIGHIEVVESALRHGCRRVIVLPNVPRPGKANRLGITYRTHMCRLAFGDIANVTVSDKKVDTILPRLYAVNRIQALIGSDAALDLLHGGKAHYARYVDSWLIMQRPKEVWPPVTSLCGKPIARVFSSQLPNEQSSTLVRTALYIGDHKSAAPLDKFFERNNLYRAVSLAAGLAPKFREGVCDMPCPPGGSKESITFMHNNDTIVKVYTNGALAKTEFDNAQLLRMAGLPCAMIVPIGPLIYQGPTLLTLPNLSMYGFQCVETLLRSAPSTSVVAIMAVRAVALSLKALHIASPGLIHGDATARNVFYNAQTQKVLWIDFLKVKTDGWVAREMYQFVSGLHYYKIPHAVTWGAIFKHAYAPTFSIEEHVKARKEWPLLGQ